MSEQESIALVRFARSSSLQKSSRRLGDEANPLEESLAALGTGGDANEDDSDRGRPPLPPPASRLEGLGGGNEASPS